MRYFLHTLKLENNEIATGIQVSENEFSFQDVLWYYKVAENQCALLYFQEISKEVAQSFLREPIPDNPFKQLNTSTFNAYVCYLETKDENG